MSTHSLLMFILSPVSKPPSRATGLVEKRSFYYSIYNATSGVWPLVPSMQIPYLLDPAQPRCACPESLLLQYMAIVSPTPHREQRSSRSISPTHRP